MFQVNGSKTLGQQTNGVNSSYFWQGNCRKLQMFGELSVFDVSPINAGDLIGVKVDYDANTISYFNNDIYQGTIFATKNTMKEGRVFCCCNLSIGTEVSFWNVTHLPITVTYCN
eukprot:TRINITY_DN13172_c0_g1_i1.p1 TRINITY_DN13172_c0_g1~~TRINITY_DN13172_c0_g1_i1.p1  ORF type:complete len:114 (-),score=19.04 TRINITY_DN13172_c0_g1_i1:113-454(-)